MATITTTTSLSFDAAASLTVGVDKNFDGSIAFTSANDDVWPSFTVTKPQSKTYGPFGIAMTVVITVVNGSLDYTINGGNGGFGYDTDGNITSLVSGDGNLLIPAIGGMDTASSAAAATLNTAIMQSALTAGGFVPLYRAGTYEINDTLVIPSNTHLYLAPGVTLKQRSGTNKMMLVSAGYQRAFSTVTLAWTAGLAATVTWVGHSRSVGEYIWLRGVAGTSQSQYSGVFLITAVSGDDLTIMLWRRPSAAPAGVYEAKVCDTSIQFSGSLDYNGAGNTTATALDAHAIIFGAVRGFEINSPRINGARKYCILVGGVADGRINDLNSESTLSDGVKVYGPARNVQADGITGNYNDDCFSVQPQESASFSIYDFTGGGDCINVTARNINAVSTNAALCVLYSSQNQYADDIEFESIRGISASARIKFYAGVGYSNCQVGNVRVRDVSRDSADNTAIIDFNASQSFNSLEIDGFLGSSSAGVASLTAPAIVFGTGFITNLTIRRLREYFASDTPLIQLNSTTGINNIEFENVRIGAGSGIGTLLRLNGTGAVRNITFYKGNVGQHKNLIDITTNVTSNPKITVRESDINSNTVVLANAACEVNLYGNRFTSSTGVVSGQSGTPTVSIDSKGNTLASGSWLASGGTAVWVIRGDDFTVDITRLNAAGSRVNGAYVMNSNAAAGTLAVASKVICDGTTWFKATDFTKSY